MLLGEKKTAHVSNPPPNQYKKFFPYNLAQFRLGLDSKNIFQSFCNQDPQFPDQEQISEQALEQALEQAPGLKKQIFQYGLTKSPGAPKTQQKITFESLRNMHVQFPVWEYISEQDPEDIFQFEQGQFDDASKTQQKITFQSSRSRGLQFPFQGYGLQKRLDQDKGKILQDMWNHYSSYNLTDEPIFIDQIQKYLKEKKNYDKVQPAFLHFDIPTQFKEELGFQESGKLFDFDTLPLSGDEEKAKTAFENVVHGIKEVTTNSNKYIGSSVDYQPSDEDDEPLEHKIHQLTFYSASNYCYRSCEKAQDETCIRQCTNFIGNKLAYAHALYMKIFKPYSPIQEAADAGGEPAAEQQASEEE